MDVSLTCPWCHQIFNVKNDQLLCLQPEKLPPSTEHALEMVSF